MDNGAPWGSWSDLPTDLALWLIGLGVQMIWNKPRCPQENGKVERSMGTGKRWAEPEQCQDAQQLQRHIDQMDCIQREEYPALDGQSRLAAFPELAHSGRSYTRRWERSHWDFQLVLEHLAGYAVSRVVSTSGHISLYNRGYSVGVLHRGRTVYVMLDPERLEWVVADGQGRQLSRQPSKEITKQNILNLCVTKRDAVSWRKRRKAK